MKIPRAGQIVPMLAVSDVELARDFYKDALGLRVTGDFIVGGKVTWCSLAADDTELFLTLDRDPRPVEDRRCRAKSAFYFYPDDVHELHASLKARGFRPSPLRNTAYGMKEFTLVDPDGHQLWFGEPTDEKPTPERAADSDEPIGLSPDDDQ